MDADKMTGEQVAWLDAATGATTTLLAATGLTESTWNSGMAWADQNAYWCSLGTGLLGGRASRPARLALLLLPLAVPAANRRALRQIRVGAATGYLGAAALGLFLYRRFQRTSIEIDKLAEEIARTQSLTQRQEVDSQRELAVVADTVKRLHELRHLLVTNREEAALLANSEAQKLRSWFAEDRAVPPRADSDVTTAELKAQSDAVARVDRSVRIFDAVLRFQFLSQVAQEVIRGRKVHGPARSESIMLVLATAHYLFALACIIDGSPRSKAQLGAADVGMNLLNSALEPYAADGSGRPQWSIAYATGLAAATGVTSSGTGQPPVAAVAMGGTRSAFEFTRSDGSNLGRFMRSFDEGAILVDVAVVSRHHADLMIDQARTSMSRSAKLAAARSLEESTRARRDHEHFLHDSALQVFLWASKPDLPNDDLVAWLDRESARLKNLLAGNDIAPVADLSRAVDDLLSGFEIFGLKAVLTVDEDLHQRQFGPVTAMCVVVVLNEALTNVLKHSQDRSPLVSISVGDTIVCRVTNEMGQIQTAPDLQRTVPQGARLGLRSMRERSVSAGGHLTVEKTLHEFTVTLHLPGEGSQ